MGDWKHNGKIGINRHQVQSKDSAARQERAIEKVTRQAGRDEIRIDWAAFDWTDADEDEQVRFEAARKAQGP